MEANLLLDEYIRKYYGLLELTPVFPKGIHECLWARGRKNSIIISDNKFFRGIARLLRLPRASAKSAKERAIQFFAMDEAFQLLSQKGVPVYFYNRVGKKKNGYTYRASERARMKKGLTFPLMYEAIDNYECELREIFGDLYSRDYVEKIGKIPQVVKIDGIYMHEDCRSEYVNVEGGRRITTDQPKNYQKTLHIYGRCGAFGYAVEDMHTLPSFLQKELFRRGVRDVRVINHGLWGGEDGYIDHNFLQDAMGFKEGDIVLFYRKHFPMKLLDEFISHGVRYRDITDAWHKGREGDERITFYNQPGHMNAYGYELTAQIISDDLIATGFGKENVCEKKGITNVDTLKYYLKNYADIDFLREIESYVGKILRENPLPKGNGTNGAIVMNCNPFTKGHRYLIEYAANLVERLYVFVVEENKSFFRFEDRLDMVKKGTEDIANVVVVPSGKFIISAYTFPEYFMKDYVKEKNFDVSLDVKTFCRYIAPPLSIKLRFAGEEPFDPVTKNYNESMAKILPQYDMEFHEVKRLRLDNEEVINATKVRELLKQENMAELKHYVPDSTAEILAEKYLGKG